MSKELIHILVPVEIEYENTEEARKHVVTQACRDLHVSVVGCSVDIGYYSYKSKPGAQEEKL